MDLIAELKRRNVIRMAGLYLVGAWLVVQVADTLFPMFGLPAWTLRGVVVLLAIGFVPTLLFAWMFELTPEGIRPDAEVDPARSIAPQTAQRMNRLIVAVLLLALVYFGVDKFVLTPQREVAQQVAQRQATAQAITAAKALVARQIAAEATAIPARSIAVLPLGNASGDEDQLYFSDGLSEDLITALAQFDGLKVISRNSAFKFRDSSVSSKAIGAQLGVAHLLEGSVRRVGDTVRITAQLVKTADDSTVWSQSYDRPFKDLFALQDEITKAIASALKARLLGDAVGRADTDRPPSGNIEAYNAWLRGEFYVVRGTDDGYRKAIDAYTKATELDPGYALAWASLSRVWTARATSGFLEGEAAERALADARATVNTALALAPDSPVAHVARGFLLANDDFNWTGARAEYQRAVQLAPGNSSAKFRLAQILATLGDIEQAVDLTRQGLATDPLNAVGYYWLAAYLVSLEHFDDAETAIRKAIELQPAAASLYESLTVIEIRRGDHAAALAAARREVGGPWREVALVLALQIGGDRAAADAALRAQVDTLGDVAAYQIAQAHALRQEPAEMFEWLERAHANRDPGIQQLLFDPFILRYRDDPRFALFARKVGLPATTPAPSTTAAAASVANRAP